MAKVRIGFSTHFEIENELAGIGTDNPTNTKQVLGNIHATNAKAVGIATLTTPFEGFVDTKLSLQGSVGAKQHTTSGEIIIEGSVNVSSGTTFTSGPENLTATDNFTLPGISDDKPTVGTMRFNENLASLEFYTGSEWRAVNSIVDMGNKGGATGRGTILIKTNGGNLHYIQASTLGNSMDFGSTFYGGYAAAGMSNSVRAVYSGGWSGSNQSDIEYYTIASKGNGVDWGADGQGWGSGGISNSVRGVVGGGGYPAPMANEMEMHVFSTTGSKVDYGDLTIGRSYMGTTGCNSPTRGTFNGGYTPTYVSVIDVKQITSTGNAVKFGDLQKAQGGASSGSSQTRGIIAENKGPAGMVTYITIASDGNSAYFGELTATKRSGVNSTQTRCIFSGGNPGIDNIEYVEIASAGNAMDFGDLTTTEYNTPSSISDSHGGLGGF